MIRAEHRENQERRSGRRHSARRREGDTDCAGVGARRAVGGGGKFVHLMKLLGSSDRRETRGPQGEKHRYTSTRVDDEQPAVVAGRGAE